MTKIDLRMVIIRSGYAWIAGTAILALAVTGYIAITDPPNRLYTLFTPVLFGVFAFVAKRHQQWLEVTDDDVALVQRRAFKTVRVGLKGARQLYLRPNGGGSAQIVAVGDGGKAFAPLYLNSMYSQCYLRADGLTALVEGVEFNRNPTSGARETGEFLRRQLEHIQADGPFATAPLAVLAIDVTGAIASVGAIGSVGNLSDLP